MGGMNKKDTVFRLSNVKFHKSFISLIVNNIISYLPVLSPTAFATWQPPQR